MCLGLILIPGFLILWRQEDVSLKEMYCYAGIIGAGVSSNFLLFNVKVSYFLKLQVGPLFSTLMLIFEYHLVATDRVVGLIYSGDTVGDIIIPWAMAQILEEKPLALIATSTVCSLVCVLLFICLAMAGPWLGRKLGSLKESSNATHTG